MYKINYKNIVGMFAFFIFFLLLGLSLVVFIYSYHLFNTFLGYFIIASIGLVLMLYGVINLIKCIKIVKNTRYLCKHGKLVKNIPYYSETTNISINNKVVRRLVVDYEFTNGNKIALCTGLRYDVNTYDSEGLIDLIIDEENPTKFLIDSNINRKGGNLPTDYYNNLKDQKRM